MLGAALLLAACGDEPPASAAPSDLAVDLCAAIAAEDAETAAETFEARVHGPLHTFIDEVAATDRAVAEQVLLAKFDVETAVAGDTLPAHDELTALLRTLHDTTRDANAALGRDAPDC